MKQPEPLVRKHANRRSFLKNGMVAAGAATISAGLLTRGAAAFGQEQGGLAKGDAAILQLLLAAEIIETDLWQQYRELGGVEATNSVSQPYINALEQLDGDMPQYISDNTDDEISHVAFLQRVLKVQRPYAGRPDQICPQHSAQRRARDSQNRASNQSASSSASTLPGGHATAARKIPT